VKTAAQRRKLQRLLNSASQRVQSYDVGTDELLEGLESSLSTLRDGATRGAVHIGEAARELGPTLERAGSGKGVMFGAPTGFPDLDRLISGWIPGDDVVIGGRPSGGKTSLGLEFGLRQARKGNAVALFSLEMDRGSIMLRLACRDAGVSFSKTRSGWLSGAELSALCSAVARVALLPVWIDDGAATSVYELRWRLRSLAQRHSIKLAIVDYLQLLRAKAENRTQEITKISIELKAAAKELGQTSNGTLLILSQLSRLAADARPQLHHLRESGQIEQDADSVFFLFDPESAERGEPSPGRKTRPCLLPSNGTGRAVTCR
jgi:replicative DNA helicase